MKVKIADWIADFLVKQGIRYNFTVPGGGAMHLNMSFGHQQGLNIFLFSMNRQQQLQQRDSFVLPMNYQMVCCTTGPGGTNTLTGVFGCLVGQYSYVSSEWADSICHNCSCC